MTVTLKSTAVVLCLSLLGSCTTPTPPPSVYKMGEKVQVGPLIYTVLSADWRTDLGDGAEKTAAKDRFLIVHLTITNSGGAQIGAPLTRLLDAKGKEHGELQEVKNLPQWLGLLRMLTPAETNTGTIVFDVPLGIYKLRVSGGEIENERTAEIELPLELKTP